MQVQGHLCDRLKDNSLFRSTLHIVTPTTALITRHTATNPHMYTYTRPTPDSHSELSTGPNLAMETAPGEATSGGRCWRSCLEADAVAGDLLGVHGGRQQDHVHIVRDGLRTPALFRSQPPPPGYLC